MRVVRSILMGLGILALVVAVLGAITSMAMVRRGFSARDEPSAIEAFIARTTRRLSMPARVKDLKNPVRPTEKVLAAARAHWADHCAICHANDGSGKTQIGQALYPRAPDMRGARTQELTDGELYSTIQNGIRLTGMPAWGGTGDHDQESWALVALIRHLPRITEQELREMEELNPKSAHEVREREEEKKFLEGADKHPRQGETP
jgi:mono/diheme cytochrome c family protein